MMYYSILASFCLLGMASSQSINTLTACLTKDQNLQMECTFTLPNQGNATCTYVVDKKVVATTNITNTVDPTFQNRGSVNMRSDKCVLTLTGFADSQPKMYNCTIQQDKSVLNMGLTVDKKKTMACSAGNTLKHGGVILLLAFVLPLLSGML
ncbi:thy-1 membrane glycoprotein [Ictalurus furcatus]|uniref:thy-1 membrane glycoprotein n=1 Tax=Ictalurus furcatus TaxID=66913 RepID=UPI0023504F96|nr:thy-1 membrane glycoprotein [Ictalurus furcatus]